MVIDRCIHCHNLCVSQRFEDQKRQKQFDQSLLCLDCFIAKEKRINIRNEKINNILKSLLDQGLTIAYCQVCMDNRVDFNSVEEFDSLVKDYSEQLEELFHE